MELIPVLDIKEGKVVRGVEGDRDSYKPVESCLTDSAEPVDVLEALKDDFELKKVYIADIDSLEDNGDNDDCIIELFDTFDLQFYLDRGIKTAEGLESRVVERTDKVIVASETVRSVGDMENIMECLGSRAVFSVDMYNGELAGDIGHFDSASELLEYVEDLDVEEIILLDIGNVGTASGVAEHLLEKADEYGEEEFITGGGVRNVNDVEKLEKHNISGVLVSTALHRGYLKDYSPG